MPPKNRELKKKKQLELKLKKAEQKKQHNRDHLSREIGYGELTVKQHEKNWKEMLVKIALPRMRQELEFAWHHYERTVDCKDFAISLLMDELKDSEEQYMRNYRAHSENMEKLMDFFSVRLEELRKDFEKEVKRMEERSEVAFENIKDASNENQDYLKTMLYEVELERKTQNRTKRAVLYSRLDEAETKNNILLQKLKATFEGKYQVMFDDTKHFIRNYNKQIRERKQEHNQLKDQDDSIQKLIAQQFNQIRHLYDTVRQLKQKHVDMKQTDGNKLIDLQIERQYFSNSFLSLKANLEDDNRNDFKKLMLLSESCAKTFDFLEDLNKKGEDMLKFAAVCRKLETQKEKVLPFPLPNKGILGESSEEELDNRDDREDIEGVTPEMEFFWQRIGQANAVRYALRREKDFLKEENELLVDTHNDYCEKLLYPPPKTGKYRTSVPKIDGNFEMKKYEKYNKGVSCGEAKKTEQWQDFD